MSHTHLSSLDQHHQRIDLVQAITAGNNIITTRLVDVGANPGQRGKDGLTLLSRAVLFGGEKLITELDVTPSFTNSVMSFSPGKMEVQPCSMLVGS